MTELTAGEGNAPKLTDGSIVKVSTSDKPFVVLDVHEKSDKVDVIPVDAKTAKDMKTVSANACKKVIVHTAEVGSFYIRDKETDAEYMSTQRAWQAVRRRLSRRSGREVGRGAEGKRAAPQARARGEGSGEEAPCSRSCQARP